MKKNTFRFALLSCLTLLLYTCKKEEPVTPPSQQFETGLPTDLPNIYYSINVAAFPPTGGLPESYILDMPPAGDQGQQGSCVAWAVAYGMKSYQRKIKIGENRKTFKNCKK